MFKFFFIICGNIELFGKNTCNEATYILNINKTYIDMQIFKIACLNSIGFQL